jgi:hypothetical protein
MQPATAPPKLPPRWICILGSTAIALHLVAILALVIAAPSGIWFTPFGPDMASPPQFAQSAYDIAVPYYLQQLKMTHNYHFTTNRVSLPAVKFEVRLKDEKGDVIDTLQFPDADANFWVRHRQSLLARGLGDDQPVPPQMGESVPAAGQQVRSVQIWKMVEGQGRSLYLDKVPEHLVPRDQMVLRPSDLSLVMANSYARYLCRKYGASSVEIVRRSQDPIPPAVLMNEPPAGAFDELIANFGEFPK